MISENIKKARKAKGISQEELAVQLHVVRQTVSKWEKGLSVPDADILIQMARFLEVPVSRLLDAEPEPNAVQDLAEALARLNAQLAANVQKEKLMIQAGRIRGIILFLSFASMFFAMAVRKEVVSIVLTGGCALAALIILYRNLALLTRCTTSVRKTGALRMTTIFDFVLILAVAAVIILDRTAWMQITEDGEKLLAVAITSAVMLFGGLIAPRLPYNRHTGLRLPWTIQDEDTWNAAHRILGIISLPLVFLYLAAVWTIQSLEAVSIIAILLWVGIPGVLSLLFFWRKFHGQ